MVLTGAGGPYSDTRTRMPSMKIELSTSFHEEKRDIH